MEFNKQLYFNGLDWLVNYINEIFEFLEKRCFFKDII